MFHNRKLSGFMLEIVILFLLLVNQNKFLAEASIKTGKEKVSTHNVHSVREQSSNQISIEEEEKPKSEDEQLYYLPMQTVFGETEQLDGTGGVSTSPPPYLTINPAPIQTVYQESTSVLYEGASNNGYHDGLYQSQCVSETPVIELESRFLFPSKDVIQESIIMAGHLEIASKTSSVKEVNEIGSIASKPSIALQGTLFHSHTVSDL